MAGFERPREVARLLSGFGRPWSIAGGWAIDLFLGRETREHKDVEVAIGREDQARLREHLPGWSFDKVAAGSLREWGVGERLDPPVHEIHARSRAAFPLEVLLDEGTPTEWRFRRNPAVARPLDCVRLEREGISFLCPEIVLLYKAKAPREFDETDFENALPALDRERRDWLRESLRVCHPGHPWLMRL